MNRRWPGDGLGLAHALERLEGVDLRSFEDGGQVLLLGLQDQLRLGAGLGVDWREGALLSFHLCSVKTKALISSFVYYKYCSFW